MMRTVILPAATGIIFLAFTSCLNYDKDNTTAASLRGDAERELRAKQHPGLHTVRILDMVFQPASLTVKHGDTVVWVNEDMLAHDVTDAVNKAWSSGRMEPAASWQKIFTESADYFCSLHSVMKGKVIVSGESPLANR